jgi:hypothetical protein
MNQTALSNLAPENVLIGALILLGAVIFFGFITAWVVIDARVKTARTREREESRREIAAYVAEGSITPEDAAKLLGAGGSIGQRIVEELGELKKIGDPRLRRSTRDRVVDQVLKPETT